MILKRLTQLLLHLAIVALATASAPARVQTDLTDVRDWVIPQGHFYTQTNGTDDSNELGYTVIDDEEALFWTWFRKLGGLKALGYPVSQRFQYKGFLAQAFHKGILLWDENSHSANLMNLFDELSTAGADSFLETHRFIPRSNAWEEDIGQPWPVITANHLALLEEDAAIKAAYYAESQQGLDPITLNGLPMGIRDYGFVLVLRAQRRAFQLWKTEQPWASEGEIVVVNGGDLAKELNLIPTPAQAPVPAPVPPFGYGNPTEGEAAYRTAGCVLCHGLQAGGGIGPTLVGIHLNFAMFLNAVREPSDVMPPYLTEQITNQEVRDILAYVRSLDAAP